VRSDLEAIKRLPVPLPASGKRRPQVHPAERGGRPVAAPGPNQVSRENGKRRIVVSANVRGRDIGSFVAEAEQAIQQQVKLPTGYWMTWGGQFENLQSATKRLKIVVPVSLLLVFTLLFVMFGNARTACWCSPAFRSR
jgi:cobalt-zinc-cadmium resistance protein CzcA